MEIINFLGLYSAQITAICAIITTFSAFIFFSVTRAQIFEIARDQREHEVHNNIIVPAKLKELQEKGAMLLEEAEKEAYIIDFIIEELIRGSKHKWIERIYCEHFLTDTIPLDRKLNRLSLYIAERRKKKAEIDNRYNF